MGISQKILKEKYERKREDTLKNRNVGWELSFKEYKTLITKADQCDYTGEKFSTACSDHYKSIERIDRNLPYVKDNCCMVLHKVNVIKNAIDEGHEGSLKIKDLEYIQKIKHTLETKSRLQLAGKYFPELLLEQPSQGENTMSQETNSEKNQSAADESSTETHLDLSIANSYVDRCNNIEGFNISFNKYKQKYLKKTCDVTGRPFEGSNLRKTFIKIDENKPWKDDNVRVVCHIVRTIVENKLFTEKELGKLVDELMAMKK